MKSLCEVITSGNGMGSERARATVGGQCFMHNENTWDDVHFQSYLYSNRPRLNMYLIFQRLRNTYGLKTARENILPSLFSPSSLPFFLLSNPGNKNRFQFAKYVKTLTGAALVSEVKRTKWTLIFDLWILRSTISANHQDPAAWYGSTSSRARRRYTVAWCVVCYSRDGKRRISREGLRKR